MYIYCVEYDLFVDCTNQEEPCVFDAARGCMIDSKDMLRLAPASCRRLRRFQLALGNIMRQQMDGLKVRERSKEERQKEREEKRKAKASMRSRSFFMVFGYMFWLGSACSRPQR